MFDSIKDKVFLEAKEEDAVLIGKMIKLSEDQLDDVAGGFTEDMDSLYTKGWWIQCPYCGESGDAVKNGDLRQDDKMHTVEYTCTACGGHFIVDGDTGCIYKKENWVKSCAKNGYKYPF